ncbi:hypothetical protein [Salisaeta longa]|uniref:hypothetical protein n=1 Tax=Salisaeta longa TaxID=503170 RepID=UPI0003B59E2A|nr:hypothetical protein [Salisaeta longa]
MPASSLPPVVDPAPYLQLMEERFGIPPDVFDAWVMVRPGKKKIYLVPPDCTPPATYRSVGLPFVRPAMKYPKPTTEAVLQFGHHATQNVIAATAAQATAFMHRAPFAATETQRAACTGRGYVIIRYQDMALGIGFWTADDAHTVRSMFPKAMKQQALSVQLP